MHFVGVYKSWIARCCCANPIVTPWDWTTTDLDVTAATPFTDPGANEFLQEQLCNVSHKLFSMSLFDSTP